MNITVRSECFGLMFERIYQQQFHFNMKQFAGSMKMLGDKLTKPGIAV